MFQFSRLSVNTFKRSPRIIVRNSTSTFKRLHPSQKQQFVDMVSQSIQADGSAPSFRTFFHITGFIFGTISLYSLYQAGYKKQTVFLPFYISRTKRVPYNFELDTELIQAVSEEQLLSKLSLDPIIQTDYRLPITLSHPTRFEIFMEEKDISIKGFEITSKTPFFKRVEKPIKFRKFLNNIMEPIEGDNKDSFKIHALNQIDCTYNIWFTGEAQLKGKNGKESVIEYKGLFDNEHTKKVKFVKAHLISEVDGKRIKEVLWE